MRKIFTALTLCIVSCIISGCCTSKEIAVMTPVEINFHANATLKVVPAPGEKNIDWLIQAVEKEIQKDSNLKLVTQDPDFYIVLSYKYAYKDGDHRMVQSNPLDLNTPTKAGLSKEKIYSEKKLNFSTAAGSVCCTVYDAKNLAPVICFNEAGYSGGLGEKVNGDGFYQNKFQKSVVEKISRKLIRQKHTVEIMRPMYCFGSSQLDSLQDAFDKGNAARIKEIARSMMTFDDFIEEVECGRYNDPEGGFKDELQDHLANYYLIVVAQEFDDATMVNLKKIRSQLSEILKYTDSNRMIKSVADSISRIEKKIAILQGK